MSIASNGGVVFWLVEKVHQNKDLKALPARDKMETALRDEARIYVEDLVKS